MDDTTDGLKFGTLIASSIASLKSANMEVMDTEQGVNLPVDQEKEFALEKTTTTDEEPGKQHQLNIGIGENIDVPKDTQGGDELSIEINGEAALDLETMECQEAGKKEKGEDVEQTIANAGDPDFEDCVLDGIKVDDCHSLEADSGHIANVSVEVKQEGNQFKRKRPIGFKGTLFGPGSKFSCTICSVSCTSEMNFLAHKAGSKHKKFVEWKKRQQDAHTVAATSTTKSFFEEQLSALEGVEPLIGLDYVMEHQNLNPHRDPKYSCGLCDLAGVTMGSCLSHITGFRHRINYLQLHHPEKVNDAKNHKKTGPSTELVSMIVEIEKLDGRGRVQVIPTDEGDDLIKASQARRAMKRTTPVDFEGEDIPNEKVTKVPGNVTSLENAHHETFDRGELLRKMNQRKDRNPQRQFAPNSLFDNNFMTSGIANIVVLNHLINFKISCDEEADLALKASRALTKSLLDYRLEASNKGGNYNNPYELPGFAGTSSSMYLFGNPQGCPQPRDANEMLRERGNYSILVANKHGPPKKKKAAYYRQRRAKRRVTNKGQATELKTSPFSALPPFTATTSFGQSYSSPYTDY
uniref:uncharacterized protein isoform X2 n=1 Tax=Myxine glutinosa TaxID=7769 RepID=UPI00358F9FB0